MNVYRQLAAPRLPDRPGLTEWQPRRGTLGIRFIACLVVIDTLCIGFSFLAVNALYGLASGGIQHSLTPLAFLPLYFLSAARSGAYDLASLSKASTAAGRSAHAIGVACAAILLVAFCLKVSASLPRINLLASVLASVMTMMPARYLFINRSEKVLGGKPHNTVLIVDDDQWVPAGGDHTILMASDSHFNPDLHDPDMYDRLAKSLSGADRVVIRCKADRRASWAHALKGANIQGEIVVPEMSSLVPLGYDWHDGIATVVVARGPLRLFDRALKRSFDVVVSAVAVCLLLPLFVLVAVLIKLDSPGPVFFKQIRIGRSNAKFRMWKFRSMRVEQCDSDGLASTGRQDNRMTRVGKLIRRTSIDELPQLLNVLRGDMSIVGPRPHALGSRAAARLFWEVDERYWHRHAAKPGLTGLAQVRGYRGTTVEEEDLVNRLQADLEYLDKWSIGRDLWIVLKTVYVLIHRNAY